VSSSDEPPRGLSASLRGIEIPVEGEDASVLVEWSVMDGRLEATKIIVTAARPITTEMMRRIRWAAVIEDAKRLHLKWLQKVAGGSVREVLERVFPEAPEAERERVGELSAEAARQLIPPLEASLGRPGRPRQYGPDHFAEVAQVYSEADTAGLPPTRTVAERFNVSRSAAAKWVARARRAGLLPKTKPRVARGRRAKEGGS
jgi:hypothetical protein